MFADIGCRRTPVGGPTVCRLKKPSRKAPFLSSVSSLEPMLSPITGNLCRNMKRSLNEARSSSSANIKRSPTNAESKESSRDRRTSQDEDQYGSDGEGEWTVFKTTFKKYKRRAPPPDLQEVIDPRLGDVSLDSRSLECQFADEKQSLFERLGMKPPSEWRVSSFPERKGLFLLPGLLRPGADVDWMKRVVDYTEPPNRTNMDAHGNVPERDVLRAAGRRLRWTTLGVEYDWNTKEYPPEGRPIPEELVLFGELVSEALGLGKMKPDATIINYYPPKSALSPHVDRSERSKAPLISLSLGQSAIYLSGGMSLDDPVVPIWLHSGDVLVMHGEQRLVYHAIPSVWPTRKFILKEDPFIADYLNEHRINMTIRQVNP